MPGINDMGCSACPGGVWTQDGGRGLEVKKNDVPYVHGYTGREGIRLHDQAETLTDLLHGDTSYGPGDLVLEAGCGVGAQTIILAGKNPDTRFISIDISEESLESAQISVERRGFANVTFQMADIGNLPFGDGSFDHVFVCFVLEHLERPVEALRSLRRVLKSGGTITVIEGDHGSAYFYPRNDDAEKAIQCLIDLQAMNGGDSLIGRSLYPLLAGAEYRQVNVSPRMVYVDASKPFLVEGFTKNTFTAMVEGVREEAIRTGMTDEKSWNKGIAGLLRTTKQNGTFCYTFFKGTAVK